MAKTKIQIELTSCRNCPYVDITRTPGAGYAFDYWCEFSERKLILGYIEYPSEIPSIPEWCPCRVKED